MLGRSGYDRCSVPVGGSGKRHKSIQTPQARDPLFFVIGLAETLDVREATIDRSDNKWNRALPQEKSEGTRQHRCHRQDAKNDIELACENPTTQLSPGMPFKGNRKRIAEGCQRLTCKVISEDPSQTPIV